MDRKPTEGDKALEDSQLFNIADEKQRSIENKYTKYVPTKCGAYDDLSEETFV